MSISEEEFLKIFENFELNDNSDKIEEISQEASYHASFSTPIITYIDDVFVEFFSNSEIKKEDHLVKSLLRLRSHLVQRTSEYRARMFTLQSLQKASTLQKNTINEYFKNISAKERYSEEINAKLKEGEDPRKRSLGEKPIPEREIRRVMKELKEENDNKNE